jgi:methylated-DNA-[protein]-cysteine S-methyltransferase
MSPSGEWRCRFMPVTAQQSDRLVVFSSRLGWMALVGGGDGAVRALTFARRSAETAVAALPAELIVYARTGPWNRPLLRRLAAYAAGEPVDFRDVPVDPGPLADFARRVLAQCRGIPYGQTRTYGQLAAAAGSPRAARAVGNCMAANRIPLIVPCHRVVCANGEIGSFSAPGGAATKRRLLAMEACGLGGFPP